MLGENLSGFFGVNTKTVGVVGEVSIENKVDEEVGQAAGEVAKGGPTDDIRIGKVTRSEDDSLGRTVRQELGKFLRLVRKIGVEFDKSVGWGVLEGVEEASNDGRTTTGFGLAGEEVKRVVLFLELFD